MNELMLNAGPEVLAIPGPSMIPARVLREFSRPMIDIYTGELLEVTNEIFAAIPRLAGSTGELFVSVSNGHGAWEMALTNTFSKGDRVLVANCGVFAAVWGEMASFLGLDVVQLEAQAGAAVDPAAVEQALRDDTDFTFAGVLMVQADTASSARNDIAAMRQAIDAAGHPALLLVDAIASFGCEPFLMDEWGVDVMVAAAQKGMMTPPGLGFNLAGPRALAAHQSAGLRTYYWDWTKRMDHSMHYLRYSGTPPVSHLFGLREALRMIDEEGIDARYARHQALANAVHAAAEAWSHDTDLALNVARPEQRSVSVTTITTGSIDAQQLRDVCQHRMGVVLGIGLREYADSSFRIGHMGHVSAPTLLGTLAAVETALGVLGANVAHSGVAAATAVLANRLGGQPAS